VSAHAQSRGPAALIGRVRTARRESWSLGDMLGLAATWAAGLLLCAIAAAIVIYMLIRGIQYLSLDDLFSRPQPGLAQNKIGGFLDPIEGTLMLTVLSILIAAPLGIGVGIWLTEYGRPAGLARAVESGVEIVAGTPSIVLAIFGIVFFSEGIFSFLSFEATDGVAFGRSFLVAAPLMSLIALPLVIGATREALYSVPRHVREASYALGKDRISTIRRVLLPASRRGIGTGIALGMGRIVGDTAIVFVLLGGSLQIEPQGGIPGLNILKGTGSTLTTYVYNNSPAGEGNAPEKAYAAAFVLLAIVIALNFGVDLVTRGKGPSWTRR
jgi:phosphate transport system permease protein